jgi:hypothetical protein
MGGIRLHLTGLPVTQPDPLDRFRRLVAAAGTGEPPPPPTPECLADDVVAALADGSLDPAARAAALPHLARCARCRSAVASVARALNDPEIRHEVAALEGTGRGQRWRLARIALPLAAAILVLLLSWPQPPQNGGGPLHRAPTITASPAPAPLSPVGAVADARRLVWTATVGADRYRVTLFDSTGTVVFETESVGTTSVLPDSVRLVPGQRYLWKVEARTDIGRWVASDLIEFSLAGGAPR